MIEVNGKQVDWVENEPVKDLLKRMKYTFPLVVVKINDEVVPKKDFSEVIIPDNSKMKVTVLVEDFTEICDINIAPSKGKISREKNPEETSYFFGNINIMCLLLQRSIYVVKKTNGFTLFYFCINSPKSIG